jgi:hypothetical protein
MRLFRLCLIALALAAMPAPLAAQTIDDIGAAAGDSMESIVCAGFLSAEAGMQAQAGNAEAAENADRRASILVVAASVLRIGQFGESVEQSMDTAKLHADQMTAILLDAYRSEGKEAYDAGFEIATRLPYCEEKAHGMAKVLDEGLSE